MSSEQAPPTFEYAPNLPEHRVAPPIVRWGTAVGFCVFGVVLWGVGAIAISGEYPDFEYFYKAGRWIIERGDLDQGYDIGPHGTIVHRDSVQWYLPFVSRAMSLLAWLPHRVAGVIWLSCNLLAMFTIVRLIAQRMMDLPKRDWMVVQFIPFLMVLAVWYWEFRLNQIDTLVLLLMTAAFVHWREGKHKLAGLWSGLAVLLKVTPALLIVWFLLKRQFRLVGVALLTILVAGPLGDVAVFGPQLTVDHYRAWFKRAVVGGSHRTLIVNQKNVDWRNQGSGVVLARWLHHTNYSLSWDDDPRLDDDGRKPAFINVVDLPVETVAMIHAGLSGALLLLLVWVARRPASRLGAWPLRFEWALFVLATLWFMPVMRRYHVILAFPAISMIAAGLHYVGNRGRWAIFTWACLIGMIVLQLMVLRTPRVPEAGGAILGATLLLGAPLIAMTLWLRRNPDALPEIAIGPDGQKR